MNRRIHVVGDNPQPEEKDVKIFASEEFASVLREHSDCLYKICAYLVREWMILNEIVPDDAEQDITKLGFLDGHKMILNQLFSLSSVILREKDSSIKGKEVKTFIDKVLALEGKSMDDESKGFHQAMAEVCYQARREFIRTFGIPFPLNGKATPIDYYMKNGMAAALRDLKLLGEKSQKRVKGE